jgi:hypothetical protein
VLPYWRKVMGAKNRVEDMEMKGHGSLWKVHHNPLTARSLAEFKDPDVFINLFGACQLRLAGRILEVLLQNQTIQ